MSSGTGPQWISRIAPLVLAMSATALAATGASAGEPPDYEHPVILASSPPSVCRVPRLLGLERRFARDELAHPTVTGCEPLKLTHVTIRRTHRRAPLIVVSQAPRAGTPTAGHRGVRITLEPAPPFPKHCRAPTLYVVPIDTPELIVWEVTRFGAEEGGLGERVETYYACVPPNGPKRVVGEGGESPLKLISAGMFIAFPEYYGGKGGGGESLHLYDVRTGQPTEISVSRYTEGLQNEPPAAELVALGEPLGMGAESVALNAGGDLAWVGEEQSPGHPHEFVLYLRDQHGMRKVAVGSEISGVAFSGSELTWNLAGVAQTAPA
ncbi:MAG: hypothetical protein ABSB69_03240 [Solirubrobacteraceae bacterium]